MSKETIDAEFEVGERRLVIDWWATITYCALFAWTAWLVYAFEDPGMRAVAVLGLAGIIAWRRLLSLLSRPRLQPEEVEQLAERLRSNVRGERGRRLAYSKEPSFRRDRLEP